MKMLISLPADRSVRSASQPSRHSSRRLLLSHSSGHSSSHSSSGFTLVEMLVVITIIGILAALVTAGVMMALRRGRVASQVTEIRQLEAACDVYKQKYGEYPPDFADSSDDGHRAVLRHLAKAFPRYTITGTDTATQWTNLTSTVSTNWNIDLSVMSPSGALVFWLGGRPDWKTVSSSTPGAKALADGTTYVDPKTPVSGFLGFSADPTDPFGTGSSRISPVFDFNLNCLYYQKNNPGGIGLWTSTAYRASAVTSPIVYFRSNNGTYFTEGSSTTVKVCGAVYPAIDTRLSTIKTSGTTCVWVNPNSIQIFSSGLDRKYAVLASTDGLSASSITGNVLQFPSGKNYGTLDSDGNPASTYDDVTNFSGGTLEDAIP